MVLVESSAPGQFFACCFIHRREYGHGGGIWRHDPSDDGRRDHLGRAKERHEQQPLRRFLHRRKYRHGYGMVGHDPSHDNRRCEIIVPEHSGGAVPQ